MKTIPKITSGNYKKYYSNSGMATSIWGKNAWDFLFTSILGCYPIKIDKKNKEHIKISKSYKSLLKSLSIIMPCIFCRESFKQFLKELPIEPFLNGRIELMFWLYQIKDKVNTKLISQEKECYTNEKKRLKQIYYKNPTIQNKKEYYDNIQIFKNKTFITQKSPSFKSVLDKYESNRAICSKTAKTCSLP